MAEGIFLIGARELARIVRRQAIRAAVALEERRLRKAETYLGWLGWQQADFSDEFLRYVKEINRFEKEQAELLNKRADTASTIAGQQIEQAEREAASARQLEQIAAEERPIAKARDTARERLAGEQGALGEAEKKIAQLAVEESLLASRLSALRKTYPPPADLREQLLAIQNKQSSIDRARPVLQAEKSRLLLAMKPLQADLKLRESLLLALDRKRNKLLAVQASAARKLQRQARLAERQKAVIARRNRALENKKKLPFQKLGRVLGDNQVSPMNQPEALREVLKHRENIERRQRAVAESQAASKSVDPARMRKFYLLLGLAAAALAAGAVFMSHSGKL